VYDGNEKSVLEDFKLSVYSLAIKSPFRIELLRTIRTYTVAEFSF
jgi:hypothetical protein